MTITIETARVDHIPALLKNLREHDKPTFAPVTNPGGVIAEAIQRSQCYTAFLDGEIVALWGADVRTLLGNTVFLWMITTPAVEQHPVILVRYATHIIRDILAEYGAIEGTVLRSNAVAIKWVLWLGAELIDTDNYNVLEFRLSRDSHPRWTRWRK